MQYFKQYPLPPELEHLPRDKRGMIIPYIVLIDKDGNPQFKINDEEKNLFCLTNRICHICGKPLKREFWFIGGQLSAFHPQGAFNDGAVHKVCGEYALRVCPYMAYSQYKAVDEAGTLALAERVKEAIPGRVLYNPTQSMERLAFFCFVKAKDYTINTHPELRMVRTVRPTKPYELIDFYLDGQRIFKAQAKQILKDKNEKSYLP